MKDTTTNEEQLKAYEVIYDYETNSIANIKEASEQELFYYISEAGPSLLRCYIHALPFEVTTHSVNLVGLFRDYINSHEAVANKIYKFKKDEVVRSLVTTPQPFIEMLERWTLAFQQGDPPRELLPVNKTARGCLSGPLEQAIVYTVVYRFMDNTGGKYYITVYEVSPIFETEADLYYVIFKEDELASLEEDNT